MPESAHQNNLIVSESKKNEAEMKNVGLVMVWIGGQKICEMKFGDHRLRVLLDNASCVVNLGRDEKLLSL